ncbi:hypothetical protein GCM10010347_10240 [Streptomyces cirratus]|uniref:Uncharacterized protein n=1 Tax=Streptomyces cirratus TaxID=68187 RepID=A0ABQ3END5_9ACTN|nr:hypothetical protein GCM10010347_10240 [Streptomyces cirratus]
MTARAAPNCTEIPAETTSATGPNRARARSRAPPADGARTPGAPEARAGAGAGEDGDGEDGDGEEDGAGEDGVIPPG